MANSENNAIQSATASSIAAYTKELDTIIKTTNRKYGRSIDTSGGGTPGFSIYWYDALSTAARGIELGIIRVPEYNTQPPVSKLHISFFTTSTCHFDCPGVAPCITFQMPEGVKKGDITKAVADYLYGEDTIPIIHTSDDDDWLLGGKHLAYRWA